MEFLGEELADAATELRGRLARGDWSIGQGVYDDGAALLAETMDPLGRAWTEAKVRMAATWEDDKAGELKQWAMKERLANAGRRWRERDGDEFGSGSCGSEEWAVDVQRRGQWTVFGPQGERKDEPTEDVAACVGEEDAAPSADFAAFGDFW